MLPSPGQNRHMYNDNEGVHYIPQSFKAEASPSTNLESYTGHSLLKSYPSVEM